MSNNMRGDFSAVIRWCISFYLLFSPLKETLAQLGNTGPGGVGDVNSNELWLRANDLNLTDGAAVTNWADVSGNGLTAVTSGVAAEEPTFATNSVNTILPSISFDGGDFLNLGNPASLNLIPQTDSWSFFIVYNVADGIRGTLFSKATSTGGTRQYQYTMDDITTYRFTAYIGGDADIGSIASTDAWFVSSCLNDATQKDSWTNDGVNFSAQGVGAGQVQTTDVLIGARRDTGPPTTGSGFLITGSIAEIAMFDVLMTSAERIIVTNYLAAKYAITLSANDVYTMDDSGYDFEVAGIGQAADASSHTDAQGTGVVRVWNPNNLDNSEFLLWGHDNTPLTASNSPDVDGTVIEQRLNRVWGVSEIGEVGTVSLSIDYSTAGGNPVGANLRLLIDRDGDGFADNDVTPIAGSSAGDIITFTGVDLEDGDFFTLGNTDISAPLPIELISFSARPFGNSVFISWSTASELNNDFFTIERSSNAIDWEDILTVPGAGTTSQKLSYFENDKSPIKGLSYYRLKQTDFDGQFSYSQAAFVQFKGTNQVLVVTPNPSNDIFYVEGLADTSIDMMLFDSSGNAIAGRTTIVGNRLIVDLSGFANGIYILKTRSENNPEIARLIKN